jgi:hypothetical protein
MFVPIRYLAPAAYKAELEANEKLFKEFWSHTPWAEK